MYKVLRFSGFSMYPTLRERDILFIKETPIEKLRRGDIILFRGSDTTICHRFYGLRKKKGELFFIERGDNIPVFNYQSADKYLSQVAEVWRGKERVDVSYHYNKEVFFKENAIWLATLLRRFKSSLRKTPA